MKQRTRICYTESQKALMWERWKAGESLHQIAQRFDRHHSSIQKILLVTGGIRPTQRSRSQRVLTLAEREEISRCLATGHSIRSIANLLGRAPSTVSREVNRHGGPQDYRASQADQAAWDRVHRPKSCKLTANPALARIVVGKLQLQWSPESCVVHATTRKRPITMAALPTRYQLVNVQPWLRIERCRAIGKEI